MTSFIQNMLWNSVEGFVEAGKRTAGGYAGDALIKAGDMIESSGRNVGSSIERRASGYSTAITGQSYQPSAKALPSTARKPAMKRSNSSPASSSTKRIGPTSKTPIGANKYPGGKQGASTPPKQITSGASGVKSMGGSGIGRAKSTAGSSAGTAKSLPKPYPNNTGYSAPSKGQGTGGEKKTAVKPGQPKAFKAQEKDDKKYTGAGSKTPVKKYKPMERMQGPAEYGKAKHIAI